MPWAIKNLNLQELYAINSIDIKIIDANFNGRQTQRRTCYEDYFHNRPIPGGCNFPCFRPERLSALHSPAPARGHRGTVHGCPLRLALPDGDLRISGRRSDTSAGQPLRTVGGGRVGAGDRQHSLLPRFDGPERASAGPLRGCTVGGDLRRCETGLFRVVPVALAATGLKRSWHGKEFRNARESHQKEKVSAMTNDRTILITGVTGKQGGAVTQALQGTGFHLRGLTRNPNSERAAALAAHGIDVVKGDLDDEATLRRALAGAWGVFGVQNAGEASVEREEAQGKRLATLAREGGVEHFVYTSVGSADRQTGVPHFDNKGRIEETVRRLRFHSHVILRPVFFMENLLAPFSLQGSTLAWALGPNTKLQMIAVDDIGWFGARAFTDAALNRREIDLAGDVRTMPEAAEILAEALGRPIAFAQTPIGQVRQYSKETALMLEWFERVGYSADIAGLEREFGRALTKLPDWARRVAPTGRTQGGHA